MRPDILCVDDEPELIESYAEYFDRTRYNVVKVSNSIDALKYLEENHQKLLAIFCDLNLPILNGLELRKSTFSFCSEIPFVLVSGSVTQPPQEELQQLKIAAFISKPLHEDSFKNFLKNNCSDRLGQLNDYLELIGSFGDDIQPLIEKLDDLNLVLEQRLTCRDTLKSYMGVLHTIKGTASSIGLKKIADFSHKFEDFLSPFQKAQKDLTPAGFLKVVKGTELLKTYLEQAISESQLGTNSSNVFWEGASDSTQKASESQATAPVQKTTETQADSSEEKIFVPLQALTDFVEGVSNLTTIRSSMKYGISTLLTRYAHDRDVVRLNKTLLQLDKSTVTLQASAEDLLRVSVSGIFRPLRKLVRDLAGSLNKNVKFEIAGEHLWIDRTLGNIISNCFVHLLRNCMDHGLESAEDRKRLGKPEEGLIFCSVSEVNGHIFIELSDDGRGIDPNIIRKKALEKKLLNEDQFDRLSAEEILMIIFHAGFSTVTTVNEISGRGVGTDMVKRTIEEAGGRIQLFSQVGKGTRFKIDLPIPMSSVVLKVFLVALGKSIFAVPHDKVVAVGSYESLKKSGSVKVIQGRATYFYAGKYTQIIGQDFKSNVPLSVSDEQTVVLMNKEEKSAGLFVDSVLGVEDVVVKKLDPFAGQRMHFFERVAFLGDGRVCLLIDLPTLIAIAHSEPMETAHERLES